MPKSVSTRSAYKMLTCIYLCRTLLFFAPYADFLDKKSCFFDFLLILFCKLFVFVGFKEKKVRYKWFEILFKIEKCFGRGILSYTRK